MIRDTQGDDIDFYVTDELQKRLLIKDYHPIFKLEVSQFSQEPIQIEEPVEENKISIVTDKIMKVGTEQVISINVEDFGGVKFRKKNNQYIELTTIRGYYHNGFFYSDYKYENKIPKTDDGLFVDNVNQNQYIVINNVFTKVTAIIPGIKEGNIFTPFFTDYVESETITTIDPSEISDEEQDIIDDDIETIDLVESYLDTTTQYDNTYIFITYPNEIQLTIKDSNNKTLHKALFPHLAYGSVEYRCVFTTPGYYSLKVDLIRDETSIKSQIFDVEVVEEDQFNEIIEVNYIESEEETELYIPNKIGKRIINPRINQPTNLKCSLNSLMLEEIDSIKDLLNSNRSNLIFTSPTNKEYKIYQFESHNIYTDSGEIEDTWFFIKTGFIDEYIELHILPTYINAMDNIIILSDNDFVDHLLNEVSEPEEEIVKIYNLKDIENEEYKTETINEKDIVMAQVPICSQPQWFDVTDFIQGDDYKVSFDCYNSYYNQSIFYINEIKLYRKNDNVYIEYNDVVDIIPYDLLSRGEHNIEFSVEDDRVSLGIDEYIISTDIIESFAPPSELKVGFQQTKLENPVTEILSIDDIDSYTYITNLIIENFVEDENIDVTIEKIKYQDGKEKIYHFPLNGARNLPNLEINIIRRGSNSYIIGAVDKTNITPYILDGESIPDNYEESLLNYYPNNGVVRQIPDSYDETTLLDYYISEDHIHVPIQYNNDNKVTGIFAHDSELKSVNLNIEDINPKRISDEEYVTPENNNINVIQTLKYFNDDLYSETYMQLTNTLLDPISLMNEELFYKEEWFEKEESPTPY